MVKILGPCFANVLEREDTDTDVLGLADKDQAKDSEVKVKLFHLLQTTDKLFLSKLLEEISEWVLLFYLLLSQHSIKFPIHLSWLSSFN